jgi:DNA-directed RNA polymerase subunit RPC12/RpoP
MEDALDFEGMYICPECGEEVDQTYSRREMLAAAKLDEDDRCFSRDFELGII